MGDDTKPISLAVSTQDYAAFQQAADGQGRPMAQLIREAMAIYRTEHLERRRPLRELPRLVGHTVVVTAMVLHELVQVVTDEKRFEPPVSMPEALALARIYLDASNVECLPIDAANMLGTLTLLETHKLGRKRVADSLLAPTLLRHDVHELITCNPGGFELEGGLTCIDPRSSRSAPKHR